MKRSVTYLFIVLSLLGCGGRRSSVLDEGLKARAKTVAKSAAEDLSLSQKQARAFETAVYELYSSENEDAGKAKDESEMSELKSRAHREFQGKIFHEFSNEKATEILAWYFNYSNTN